MRNYLKQLQSKFQLKKYILLLTIAHLTVINTKGQDLDNDLQRIIYNAGTPGIQVSYSNNQNIKTYVKGIKKYGTNDSILEDTRFQAASLTKVIATYAFFKLMDQGLIDLDTPLYNYYPYDRLKNTNGADKITARMVLTHRTGLLNWEGDVPSSTWRSSPLTLQFEPGTDYMYSGEGFYFLQETMEHLTKKTFQQIIEDEVFTPLQMTKSNIVWNDSLSNITAYGHYAYNSPRKMGTYLKSNAAYTLYTTSKDYINFIQRALINGNGLNPKTHSIMVSRAAEAKKQATTHPDDKYVPCTLGFRMQINEQGIAYWHTGSNPGFRCFFITYPNSNETLVAFMNSDSAFPAMKDLMKLFLTPEQTFWAYDWRLGELD